MDNNNMKNTLAQITAEYRKWRNNWDELCNRCGQCCCKRFVTSSGEVKVDYSSHCKYLDEETHLCKVFENRFHECSTCGKVNMYQVLFNPSLPSSCAYVKTFRLWEHHSTEDQKELDNSKE